MQETHLGPNDLPNPPLPGRLVVVASTNTSSCSRKGGVAIATRPDVCADPIQLPHLPTIDACAVAVHFNEKSSASLVCVYVAPGSASPAQQLELIWQALPRERPVIWAGDFNPSGWQYGEFTEAVGAVEANDDTAATYLSGAHRTCPD